MERPSTSPGHGTTRMTLSIQMFGKCSFKLAFIRSQVGCDMLPYCLAVLFTTGTHIVQTQGLCMASWHRCTSLRCSLELLRQTVTQKSLLLAMMVKWCGRLEPITPLRSPCHSCPLTLNWGGLGHSNLRLSHQPQPQDQLWCNIPSWSLFIDQLTRKLIHHIKDNNDTLIPWSPNIL